MAPEVLGKSKYSEKADVFSFGVLVTEVFTGRIPFGGGELHPIDLAKRILEGERASMDGLSPELQSLVQDCWHANPKLRPTMMEITTRLRRLRSLEDDSDLFSVTVRTDLSTVSEASAADFVDDGETDKERVVLAHGTAHELTDISAFDDIESVEHPSQAGRGCS